MNRKHVLWVVVAALIVAGNVYILRNPRHPHRPLAGKESQQVEKILEWEAAPAVTLKQPVSELMQVLASYPADNCPDNPGASHVPSNQLSAHQRDDLFNAVATLFQCYEKSSPDEVVSYMRGRNEDFDSAIMNLIKEEKVRDRLITRDELKTIADRDFFTKVWGWKKCSTFWSSIVMKIGYVCVRRCHSPSDARNAPLGKAISDTFRNTSSHAHLFKPKFSLEDACKRTEGVLVAEVMAVIEHAQALNMERSPYFFRFWYSEHDGMWHPFALKHVSTQYGAPGPAVDLLF